MTEPFQNVCENGTSCVLSCHPDLAPSYITCEWQESNLRTPTRTDLESVTFGLLVTLAPKFIIERVIYRHNSYVVLSRSPLAAWLHSLQFSIISRVI